MHKPMETQQMDTTSWFKRLLDARTQSKLTQRELAQQLGVPQGHISRIERGLIDPRVSTVTQMAYALGLTPMLVPRQAQVAVLAVLRNFERNNEPDRGRSAVETLVADDRVD